MTSARCPWGRSSYWVWPESRMFRNGPWIDDMCEHGNDKQTKSRNNGKRFWFQRLGLGLNRG